VKQVGNKIRVSVRGVPDRLTTTEIAFPLRLEMKHYCNLLLSRVSSMRYPYGDISFTALFSGIDRTHASFV
jgi:hypothetical protein